MYTRAPIPRSQEDEVRRLERMKDDDTAKFAAQRVQTNIFRDIGVVAARSNNLVTEVNKWRYVVRNFQEHVQKKRPKRNREERLVATDENPYALDGPELPESEVRTSLEREVMNIVTQHHDHLCRELMKASITLTTIADRLDHTRLNIHDMREGESWKCPEPEPSEPETVPDTKVLP